MPNSAPIPPFQAINFTAPEVELNQPFDNGSDRAQSMANHFPHSYCSDDEGEQEGDNDNFVG
jgi:hypothetical protein